MKNIIFKKYDYGDYDFISSNQLDLIFQSDDGAMGFSGLLLIIVKNCGYVLNHKKLLENNEIELWNNAINATRNSKALNPNIYSSIYLGCGNEFKCSNKVLNEFTRLKKEDKNKNVYHAFKELLTYRYGIDSSSIRNMI